MVRYEWMRNEYNNKENVVPPSQRVGWMDFCQRGRMLVVERASSEDCGTRG